MEAGDDVRHGPDRVVDAEHEVRGRHRRLGHHDGVHEVAEVEQPADARVALGGVPSVAGVDEDVVVVRVTVDHRASQAGEPGLDVGHEPVVDPSTVARRSGSVTASRRSAHDPRGLGDVPVELAVRLGVVVAVERHGETAERAPRRRAAAPPWAARRGPGPRPGGASCSRTR